MRDAFLAVPREHFVPEIVAERGLEAIYLPLEALVTKKDSRGMAISSSSAPSIMAPMLENLELDPGHRVLEIGAGTGYNAALIKHIVGSKGRVSTIDIDADTVRRARRALRGTGVSVHVGDGRDGYRLRAPYDRIIVTASSAEIPHAWFEQLVDHGLIELPLRLHAHSFGPQLCVTFRKEKDRLRSVASVPGGFMVMRPEENADAMQYAAISVNIRARGKNIGNAITGHGVEALSVEARRRLAAVLAQRPRRRQVARVSVGGLALFVALSVPPARLVEGARWWSSGVVEPSGGSVATIVGNHLVSFGSRGAEREIERLVDEWRAAGRPEWSALRIEVTYGRSRPNAWRTSKRGDAVLSFDWNH